MKKCLFGYCRVSSKKQNLERQIENIQKAYGSEVLIFKEKFTGTKIEGRKEFNSLLRIAKKEALNGSEVVIIFDSVSRMSRNADEGIKIYFELFDLGIDLIFLKEPHINSMEYRKALDRIININLNIDDASLKTFFEGLIKGVNGLILDMAKNNIKLAFEQAEKEVSDIQTRTKEGLRVKKEMYGITPGPKKGSTYNIKKKQKQKDEIKKYSKSFGGTLKDDDVMRLIKISHSTYYKYKKELYEELAIEVEAV